MGYSLQFIYLYSTSMKADNVISKVLNGKNINIKEIKNIVKQIKDINKFIVYKHTWIEMFLVLIWTLQS